MARCRKMETESKERELKKATARELWNEMLKATAGDPEKAIKAMTIGRCANGMDLMSKPMPESHISMAERYKNQ